MVQCDQDEGGVVTCEDPVCTECDPADGVCKDIQPPPQQCVVEAICRTPGFWGTHGGSEKDGPNVTQAVIDHAGCLEVCGEIITNTAKDDAESALEAICVKVKGQQTLQLARQLTSMALNCVISGFGANCAGNQALGELFSECNAACISGDVGDCIGEVDCFNNGGTFVEGTCVPGGEDNCHDPAAVQRGHRPLLREDGTSKQPEDLQRRTRQQLHDHPRG